MNKCCSRITATPLALTKSDGDLEFGGFEMIECMHLWAGWLSCDEAADDKPGWLGSGRSANPLSGVLPKIIPD